MAMKNFYHQTLCFESNFLLNLFYAVILIKNIKWSINSVDGKVNINDDAKKENLNLFALTILINMKSIII